MTFDDLQRLLWEFARHRIVDRTTG